jgi:8-oxo-dGTP diphosphatase
VAQTPAGPEVGPSASRRGRAVELIKTEGWLRSSMAHDDIARVVNVAVLSEHSVLVLRRALTDSLSGYWEIPGGAVEPGESFAEAAKRELVEETGIQANRLDEVLHLSGPAPSGFRQRNIEVGLFRLRAEPRPMVRVEPREHSAFNWLPPGDLRRLRMMDINRSLAVLACTELSSESTAPRV